MRKTQTAVIDFGSSKITAIVGGRGINKTFLIKARKDFPYDGYADGEFFDVGVLKNILKKVSEFIKESSHGALEDIYVGVPGGFTEVFIKDSQISFPKKKRIVETDIDELFEAAFVVSSSKYALINRSAVVYELDDYRRVANPVGYESEILKGKLSFIVCDKYFIEAVNPVLYACGFSHVEFVSTEIAEAMYLIDGETRDRIAIMVDVGYIATTLTLIQGDGILFKDSFGYGGGYITAALTETFDMEFNDAEELKRKVNLSREGSSTFDLIGLSNGEFYNADTVITTVKKSLEVLCEKISDALDKSGYVIPDYVPIYLTGGGIVFIRGAKEHIASRLGISVEVVSPKVPLMEKPTESSVLSLLDLVFEQQGIN